MPKKSKAPKGTYWRGNTLWGRYKINGQEYRWSLETDDPKLAKKRRDEGKNQALRRQADRNRLIFEDLIPGWDRHIRGQVSEKTVQRYLSSLDQISHLLEGRYLDEIDAKLIGQIIEERQLEEVTHATIKRDLVALSSVVNFAVLTGKMDNNPVVPRMSLINERRDPIVLPTDEQIFKIISHAPGMFANLIEAAWKTGCRQGELSQAKRSQLDTDRKQLTILKAKRGKIRVIDLEPFKAHEFFSALPVKLPYLFWHDDGVNYKNVSSRFRAISLSLAEKDSSFVPFRFHHLRHRHAVDWLKSGRSLYDLQKRLGHESLKTTEMYLIYLTPEEERSVKFAKV
jgi:integrase/recombinase XerD